MLNIRTFAYYVSGLKLLTLFLNFILIGNAKQINKVSYRSGSKFNADFLVFSCDSPTDRALIRVPFFRGVLHLVQHYLDLLVLHSGHLLLAIALPDHLICTILQTTS